MEWEVCLFSEFLEKGIDIKKLSGKIIIRVKEGWSEGCPRLAS